MQGRKPKDKNRVDIDYIVSWALYHSKIPVKKIAEERELADVRKGRKISLIKRLEK